MVTWTGKGEGKSDDPGDDRHIDVQVVDVYGNIASVVVRSPVYREYLHLVQTDEGWKIVNALWHWT
ncbi:MAG: nuclear transport factor 2 family protein [Actinomycetota bacterium]